MSTRSVIHDTFTIERTYPATPSRVFAAFASEEAKSTWGDTGDLQPADADAGAAEFDFRVGGRERFSHKWQGTTYRYDGLYYDIVPDQRIVYSYEMYADDVRISVSVTTIEFVKTGAGTALTYTEQGAAGTSAPRGRHGRNARRPDQLPRVAARILTASANFPTRPQSEQCRTWPATGRRPDAASCPAGL